MSKRPPCVPPPPAVHERPQCPMCEKPLTPEIQSTWEWKPKEAVVGLRSVETARGWTGRYNAYGAFCTLKCCEAYANEMFRRTGQRFRKARSTQPPKDHP